MDSTYQQEQHFCLLTPLKSFMDFGFPLQQQEELGFPAFKPMAMFSREGI